jgi:transposase-like protein
LPEPQYIPKREKSNGKQNYLCKDCGRQFISGQDITYQGCLFWVVSLVNIMFVRGIGHQYGVEHQYHQGLKSPHIRYLPDKTTENSL